MIEQLLLCYRWKEQNKFFCYCEQVLWVFDMIYNKFDLNCLNKQVKYKIFATLGYWSY